jgi:protein tyrosine/serine phosphatase
MLQALALLAAVFAVASPNALRAAQQGGATISAPQPRKISFDGVPNQGLVSPVLYRGGQPEQRAYAELKSFGIETVVNFRDDLGEIEKERKAVEALGMRFVSIPWSPRQEPTSQQVAEFLELLRSHPEQKVFVHCRYGSDRTGVMVAAYRISVDHWTPENALDEMNAYHYHHFFYPHLKSYVKGLPIQFAEDPRLRAFAKP